MIENKQCKACPWKRSTRPAKDIPNNYAVPTVDRRLLVSGTGHRLPLDSGQYVGTFQVGGSLVFHLFDLGETQ